MKETHFLVFWVGDGGDRESYNVYHSKIVKTENKREAIVKYHCNRNLIKLETFFNSEDLQKEFDEIYKYYDTIKIENDYYLE